MVALLLKVLSTTSLHFNMRYHVSVSDWRKSSFLFS